MMNFQPKEINIVLHLTTEVRLRKLNQAQESSDGFERQSSWQQIVRGALSRQMMSWNCKHNQELHLTTEAKAINSEQAEKSSDESKRHRPWQQIVRRTWIRRMMGWNFKYCCN